jgi:hypothetical protein
MTFHHLVARREEQAQAKSRIVCQIEVKAIIVNN